MNTYVVFDLEFFKKGAEIVHTHSLHFFVCVFTVTTGQHLVFLTAAFLRQINRKYVVITPRGVAITVPSPDYYRVMSLPNTKESVFLCVCA